MAIGDGFERRLEVGMRVDPVHFRRFDQTSDAGPGRRTLVVAGEQRILAIQRQRADRVLDHVIPEPGLFRNRCLGSRLSLQCRVPNA